MSGGRQEDLLEQELRHALQHLYDPTELRKSRLLAHLAIEVGPSPLTQLRRVLADAIESLKPSGRVPADAHAWRVYNILTYRFVEQLGQRETATDLNLSVRQLRRNEHEAVEVLAHAIEHRYQVTCLDPTMSDAPSEGSSDDLNRAGELAWLRQTLASETIDVRSLIDSVLATAAPLLEDARVEVTSEVPAKIAPMKGQPAAIRQALLNILSAAVPSATGGRCYIRVSQSDQGVALALCVEHSDGTLVPLDELLSHNLDISRELIALAGGALSTATDESGCSIAIALPSACPAQVSVHAIEDNADTLRLFQRYLADTPFKLTSSRNPETAVSDVVKAAPEAIVLDVMLPGVDGWELLGNLREHPRTEGIPVVICTILPQEQLALALGAAAFLQKPFTREGLLAVLADLTQPET